LSHGSEEATTRIARAWPAAGRGDHGAPQVVRWLPRSPEWLSGELLARTQEVWSEVAGRPISHDETIEILINVRRPAEVLLDLEDEPSWLQALRPLLPVAWRTAWR